MEKSLNGASQTGKWGNSSYGHYGKHLWRGDMSDCKKSVLAALDLFAFISSVFLYCSFTCQVN